MKIVSNKKSLTVRTVASVLMVPKAIALIPVIIRDNVEDFKTEVRGEMETRVNSVRHMSSASK